MYQEPELPLTIRPQIINALLPLFMANMLKSVIPSTIISAIYAGMALVGIKGLYLSTTIFIFFGVLLLLTVLPMLYSIFVLAFTRYSLFDTHVESEFRFIAIQKKSAVYGKITNITTHMSVWDRICGAGDVYIHTANDDQPDVVLKYVKNPENIEKLLYSLIHSKRVRVHTRKKSRTT